jgi:hypothetical protein
VTDLTQLGVAGLTRARRWPPKVNASENDPTEAVEAELVHATETASAPEADGAAVTDNAGEATGLLESNGAREVIDLTADEPIEHVPSLEGARTRLAWAESHLQLFRGEWQKVIDTHAYTFIHEVHADGLNHRYRAVAVPDLDPKWTLLLGDCIHNLRGALDQLVYELVRIHGGKPALRTQFPVYTEPGGVRVQGGIPDEALRLIESVQPYTKSFDGSRIRLIHHLDLVDRQRQLPLAACASGRRITVNFRQPRVAPQVVKSWTSDRALEPGKTVHGCEYITPYYQEDPSLKVIPHLVVEDSVAERVFGRIPAPELVGERLLLWVRETFLPRFEHFFQ